MLRLALVALIALACAREALVTPEPGAESAPAAEPEPAPEPPPQRARIQGEAAHAKGGPVVLLSNGPVYVRGLDAWPDEVLGEQVIVQGLVADEKLIPDPVTEDGEIAQGAWGTQRVVSDVTWEVVE
jgi:hypothetical protein